MASIIHPVPIEMHHIKGLLGCGGALQSLLQRWESRWGKHSEFGQFPQALYGFDQRQGAAAVVDVVGMGIFRSGRCGPAGPSPCAAGRTICRRTRTACWP